MTLKAEHDALQLSTCTPSRELPTVEAAPSTRTQIYFERLGERARRHRRLSVAHAGLQRQNFCPARLHACTAGQYITQVNLAIRFRLRALKAFSGIRLISSALFAIHGVPNALVARCGGWPGNLQPHPHELYHQQNQYRPKRTTLLQPDEDQPFAGTGYIRRAHQIEKHWTLLRPTMKLGRPVQLSRECVGTASVRLLATSTAMPPAGG